MDEASDQDAGRQAEEGAARESIAFPVVGIGASAGGLQALLCFFEQMPATSGMAFVVILHLSPKHESNAAAVLQQATRMPVSQVTERVAIVPDRVYVIPPSKHLSMDDGVLRLSEAERPRGRHASIDLFFRTLGDAHKHRAVCIILSGTGADGTVGLKRIKEQGGITIAQSPEDAEYESMPRNAIATGMVDFVLPAVEMPQRLLQLWQNATSIKLPLKESEDSPHTVDESKRAEQALRDILTLLRVRTGHDFTHYKRATMLRRLERRLQVSGLQDLSAYYDFLREHAEEAPALLKDMLISVTNFFRDREAFEALEREVVPRLFEGKTVGDQVRVWVPGCATGEEAYSVAMLLIEHAADLSNPPQIQVFATDIDEAALATAREGSYPESIVTDIPPARLRHFFTKQPGSYVVNKSVRERVLFAKHNLIKDPPFSKLDLIACRNLLIYLNRHVQDQVLELLHFSLGPAGYLFLGISESADSSPQLFTTIDKKNRVFRASPFARARAHVPPLPLGAPVTGPLPRPEETTERKRTSFGELHQKLLEQYSPPSVIINPDYDIVHLSDRAGRFLQFAAGEPSHNLLRVVHPELRPELRTALFQAVRTGKSVEARRVQIKRDGRTFFVNMIVRPVREIEAAGDFIFVIFDEVEDTLGADGKEQRDDKPGPVVRHLEEELQRTKEQLRATVEQYETQAEELKSSNEELQSTNEELRSTTEELETSKEELQSINEELTTVNQELRSKVDEVSQINDDLQNLISSTDIATIFIDRALRVKRYTPRAVNIFNLIPSDIGRPLLDITHRLDYEGLVADTEEVFETLRVIEREMRSEDGRWYISRLVPYRTTEDRIAGAVLAFIDITGRRQVEERLRGSEERLRLLVESAKDYAIFALDTEGRINTWNTGAERIFGFTEAEAIGQSMDLIFLPEDRARGVPQEKMKRAREEGRAEDERWHMRKDGSRFYASGVMAPLRDSRLYGYVKIARDLTEKRKAEAEREELLVRERAARAEAEAANRLKDEFLATLSHELRNPLNLIAVNAEVLLRTPEVQKSARVARAAGTIRRTVSAQAQMIDDLLDLSRLQTGKLGLKQQLVPLALVIADAVGAVSVDAEAKGVTLDVDLTSEPLVVEADTVRVRQIAWNLLSNAVKFTGNGGRVEVKLNREDKEARLEVADTGQGIDPKFLPHVFELFRQADIHPTRKHGGMGIGLALVRQLTELHGGHVEAASEGLNRGARFAVWLPLHAVLPEVTPPRERKAASPDGELSGLRILIVDDAPDNLEALYHLLKLEGADVTTADGGAEALRAAEAEDFDLILSDISMPEMDGYELMRELRKRPRTKRVPAIALTGYGRTKDAELAREAGYFTHLTKPIIIEKLIAAVRAAVGKRAKSGSDSELKAGRTPKSQKAAKSLKKPRAKSPKTSKLKK